MAKYDKVRPGLLEMAKLVFQWLEIEGSESGIVGNDRGGWKLSGIKRDGQG